MITALTSFLGGSLARMLLGELFAWWTKKQDHSQEMDRMRLQGEQDAAQHARNMDSIRLQAELGVKTIQVQAEAYDANVESDAWLEAVKATGRSVGVAFVDAWNAVIRPGVATWAVVMMTLSEFAVFTLSQNAVAVCSAALGIYLADRNLMKRGK